MALAKAVVAGAAAALAVPYALGGKNGALNGWLDRGSASFDLGGWDFTWSWPVFAIVTLFVWGLLAWANK